MRLVNIFKGAIGAAVVILIAILLGLAAAALFTKISAPIYKAQASLYLSLQSNKSATDLNQGSTYVQSQMVSFAQLATAPVVLDPVISELQLKSTPAQLAGSVSATIPANSSILQVSATSSSAQAAADIANSVAAHLGQAVEQMGPKDADNKSIMGVKIIQSATVPSSPSSPNADLNQTGGALVGLIAGVLAVIGWRGYAKKRPTTVHLADETGLPIIGEISRDLGPQSGKASVPHHALASTEAEQYRRMRENLRAAAGGQEGLCIALTSAISGKAAPSACYLGLAFAETGASVLVIDADLRSSAVAVRSPGASGLAEYLADDGLAFEAVIDRTFLPGIDVVLAGTPLQAPGKLISSARMAELVKAVRSEYEVVLVNVAPVPKTADAAVIGALAQGSVVGVALSGPSKPQINDSLESLKSAGVTVLGLVVSHPRLVLNLRRSGRRRVERHAPRLREQVG